MGRGYTLPQVPFDPAFVWAPAAYENQTVPYFASTYQVQIGRDPETLDGAFEFLANVAGTDIQALEEQLLLGEGIILPDPTNEPGRIEITAQQADLTSSASARRESWN